MADDDLDIIPTLDDIIVTGDLSKAVIDDDPDIDEAKIQDLASTDHFNALFEPSTDHEEPDLDDKVYLSTATLPDEAITDQPIAETYSAGDDLSASALIVGELQEDDEEPAIYDISTTDRDHDDINTDNTFVESPVEIEGDESTIFDSDAPQANDLDTPSDEIIDGILLTEASELTVTNDTDNLAHDIAFTEKTDEDTVDTNPADIMPQIDIDHLVENIMLEMMPHLEVQIRAQILSSLAKHLPESVVTYDNEHDIEKD